MNKLPIVFTSILIILGTVFAAALFSVPAYAAPAGVVCIIPNGTSSCPSSPASITGTVGSQLRVSVFLQNSSGINGFDVTILADHTILRPEAIDLTGSVLQGIPTVIVECLSGILVSGSTCANTDTIDTIELAATSALGSGITSTPTTGLLFTALYNVTQKTIGTSLGFQAGCSSTSVGPNVCVTLANGTPTPVPETIETAFVSTSAAPNFLLSANPSSLTIVEGSSAASTITLTSINGLNGTASLSTLSPPLCAQPGCSSWTLSPTSVILSAGGVGTATLSIFAGTAFPGPGNSLSLPINGTINGLSHSISVVFTTVAPPVPDFTIQASPTILSVSQGFTGSSLFTLGSIQGFSGTVTLAASSSPTGLVLSLTQTNVVLSSGATGTSELSVATLSTTPVGSYSVTVAGSAGSISHTVTITVTVTSSTSSGDFTLADSATFISIPVASERQTTVTVTSVNGFSGNVNLVITPSSAAFACWFTTLTNTATVFVPAGGFANQFPTCGAGTPAGAYSATISGTIGSLSHAIILGVTVTDYSMSASSVSFTAGSSAISTVILTSLFGLSGPISLSVSTPSGLSGTCPSSVTLSSGGTSTASCTFSSTTPGMYGATITGTFVCSDCYFNGKDVHSSNITVTVSGTGVPDFSISAAPTSLTITPGASGTSTITLSSINGFSGIISLTVTHSSGIGAVINPTSITGSGTATLTIGANMTGTFSVQVTGSSGTLSHSVSVSVTVASIGVVCVIPSGNTSCPISSASLTGVVGSQVRVSIFIQGSGGLNGFDVIVLADHTILRPVGVDLAGTVLIGTPTIIDECLQGILVSGSVCSTVDTIDTLHLVATSALGSGITATPTTGLLFTAIYNVTGATSGITLGFQTGCINTSVSGGICVTVANGTPIPVPETVQTATFSNSAPSPDFSINASPTSLTTSPGSCVTSTVTLGSINGFSGTIIMTTSVSPTGPTATLSITSVSITSGGSATAALTVCTTTSTPSRFYTATVTATSGSISHSTTVAMTVTAAPNFTITATPTGQNIRKGSSAIFTITIKGTNGFNGAVSLTTTISPIIRNGPAVSLPSAVGPYSNSTLTVATAHSTTIGTYTITVTATSGSITHTVTITVVVTK